MLGERVLSIVNRLGQTQRSVAELLGFDETTLSKWIKREEEGKHPDTKSYERVSATLLRDMGWLMGDPDAPEWSPQMRKIQRKLRELALSCSWDTYPTKRDRLLFIHEKLAEQILELTGTKLDSRFWAWHLYWSVEDWSRFCANPEFGPSDKQIEGAAAVTGLPVRWFFDGGSTWLEEMPPEELRELGALLRSLNMDPIDAKRILTQRRTPRQ